MQREKGEGIQLCNHDEISNESLLYKVNTVRQDQTKTKQGGYTLLWFDS